MSSQHLLGQLNDLHQMMNQLLESIPEAEAYRRYHPHLAPLAWYLGRSMYLETYWLREVVQGDDDMTTRLRDIFRPGPTVTREQISGLPPKDHLLNWAMQLQDENIRRLANPRLLPSHPLRTGNQLELLITQEHARQYEYMLMVLTQRQLQLPHDYRAKAPLQASRPSIDAIDIQQGHYRIGAKQDPAAYDNEGPAQIVDLSSFRIDRNATSNTAYLAFMQEGGYQNPDLWDESGWVWRQQNRPHPEHWRRDERGNWFAIGLNGPFDLTAGEPVTGLSRHEASAYARWVAGLDSLAGAVLQHEYQWEVAVRMRAIKGHGRAWEWCSNLFRPYDGYRPCEWPEGRTSEFDDDHYSLRGASIHTLNPLRRSTFRQSAPAGNRHLFTGLRLVFPPSAAS